MAKKRRIISRIDGRNPWQVEIDHYVERGLPRQAAQLYTVMRWMHLGNLQPLRVAIAGALHRDNGKADGLVRIEGVILAYLVELIDQGRLVVKPARRGKGNVGRPKSPSPDKFARDLVGALRYERSAKKDGSEAAFKQVADELRWTGMTENALREAVTMWRKLKIEMRKDASTD
jgi:hypothetical protein